MVKKSKQKLAKMTLKIDWVRKRFAIKKLNEEKKVHQVSQRTIIQ
jgi:hypothetical protein